MHDPSVVHVIIPLLFCSIDATVSFAVDAISVSESAGDVTIQVTLVAMAIEVPIEIPITGMSGTASEYCPPPPLPPSLPPSLSLSLSWLTLILNSLLKYSNT